MIDERVYQLTNIKLKDNAAVSSKRFNELDFLRGICIILMILDHFMLFTLKTASFFWLNKEGFQKTLFNLCFEIFSSETRWAIRITVLMIFFIISGISSSLSKNNLLRSVKLAVGALLITVVTYFISSYTELKIFVAFGVIHFYALNVFIWWLINLLKSNLLKNSIYSVIIIACGFVLLCQPKIDGTNILMWLGIPSSDFSFQFDYIPYLPWSALFIAGGLTGQAFYKNKTPEANFFSHKIFKPIEAIGRNGLILYLLHLPVIILIIYLIGFI